MPLSASVSVSKITPVHCWVYIVRSYLSDPGCRHLLTALAACLPAFCDRMSASWVCSDTDMHAGCTDENLSEAADLECTTLSDNGDTCVSVHPVAACRSAVV